MVLRDYEPARRLEIQDRQCERVTQEVEDGGCGSVRSLVGFGGSKLTKFDPASFLDEQLDVTFPKFGGEIYIFRTINIR